MWDELTNDPISHALERLASAQAERERYKAADVSLRRDLARIEDNRFARRNELLAEAERVLKWRDEFLRHPRTLRIWELLGDDVRLPLFVSAYWDGRLSDSSVASTVVVMTGGLHQLRLEGWGMGERKTRGPRLTQPGELVQAFHPDMLVEFRLHLEAERHERLVAEVIEHEYGRYAASRPEARTA